MGIKEDTALSFCGWGPRELGSLPRATVQELLDLIADIEEGRAEWPELEYPVVLPPKKGGSTRRMYDRSASCR